MFFRILAVFVALAAIGSTPALADAAAGKIKVEAVCQTCHGMDGIATTPVAANLSGQQEIYIKIQLERFRSGMRKDPQMNIIAKMLSDEDIANVSAYYSGIKVSVKVPE